MGSVDHFEPSISNGQILFYTHSICHSVLFIIGKLSILFKWLSKKYSAALLFRFGKVWTGSFAFHPSNFRSKSEAIFGYLVTKFVVYPSGVDTSNKYFSSPIMMNLYFPESTALCKRQRQNKKL